MSIAQYLTKFALGVTPEGLLSPAKGGTGNTSGGGSTSPTITAIAYPGDDTAADVAGGQTITLTGTNFVSGALVMINGVVVSVVSFINSTTITFVAPVLAAGSYIVYVVNPNGTTALAVPGIQYSGTPAWTTATGTLGTVNKEVSFTTTITASGDAPITYSLISGTLPAGITLNSSTGVLSGTSPTVTNPTTYTFTVRSTDAQLQSTDRAFSITVTVSPVPQIGTTTYDATGIAAVTDISELASNSLVMSNLPSSGYLKYSMRIGSTTTPITVSYQKTSSTSLAQSAFSLLGQSLTYVDGAVSAILQGLNDDHDTLFIDADGRGVLARANSDKWGRIGSSGADQFTKFSGTTTVVGNSAIDSVVTYPISSFITPENTVGTQVIGDFATLVSFPLTNSGIWINLTTGRYKTNNFSGTALPGSMASVLGTTTTRSTLYTISDGVNQFIIGRYGTEAAPVTAAFFCKVDLTTGVITATTINYSSNILHPNYTTNNTEEDAVGDQLFTVDCFNTFLGERIFYYQGSTVWNNITTNPFNTTGKSAFTAGPGSGNPAAATQSGLDIFGSVDDADRYVWFADWGHDNGGLYNVGDDVELGTRKTNIKLIPTNYTN